MDFLNLPLFAAATLVFLSVLAGLFSARAGLSFLLVFLLAGVAAGLEDLGGVRFEDLRVAFWVGNVALAIILLDGGLRTQYSTFRTGLKPAALLATVGVVVCAGVVAMAAVAVLGLPWPTAWLLGAIVGSTDAAAVFALLTRSGVLLNERVAATLEIESGVNDPMAVYLTLAFIALIAGSAAGAPAPGEAEGWRVFVLGFAQQFGFGTLLGVAGGFGMAALLERVAPRDAGGGILALLLAAGGLVVFAGTGWLGGSGFLAIYLYGLIVGNRAAGAVQGTLAAMDGYAWLSQAGMFLLLGLLVTPALLAEAALPGLVIALVLMFLARPLAVWLCLLPFRFVPSELWFVSWVGLRGAVPIVLALFPLLAGTPQAQLLFHVAFVVVLVSLLLQGTTIALAAHRLGVALPDPGDELEQRAVFRDFAIDPRTPVGALAEFYGLPAPAQPELSVERWLERTLKRPPVAGDSARLGGATLVVREVAPDGRITAVGLGLPQ